MRAIRLLEFSAQRRSVVSAPQKGIFPRDTRGELTVVQGETCIWKAWLETLISRQLQSCCSGGIGVRVIAVSECAHGSTCSFCEHLVGCDPPQQCFQAPTHSLCGPGPQPLSWQLRHLLLRMAGTVDRQGMLQSSQDTQGTTLSFDLCRCTGVPQCDSVWKRDTKLGVPICK